MNALTDGHINSISGGRTFSDQPVAVSLRTVHLMFQQYNIAMMRDPSRSVYKPVSVLSVEFRGRDTRTNHVGGPHLELNHPGNKPGTRNYR